MPPRTPMRTPADDRSLGELFKELTLEARTLVRQEVALAKLELREELKQAARNGSYVGAGGAVAYVALFALAASLVLLLAGIMPAWLSALVVALLFAGVGYALIQKGMAGFKEMEFSLPRTADTLEDDKEWLKEEMR